MNPAEALARATGSVSAKHTVTQRHPDGTLIVEEEHEFSRERVVLPPISQRTATLTFDGHGMDTLIAAVGWYMHRTGSGQAMYDRLVMADLEAHREFAELHNLPIDDEEGAF